MKKHKILIFIVTYNAEKHLQSTLARIPQALWDNPHYDVQLLIIDDASKDNTVEVARNYATAVSYPVTVMCNPVNQGYGGNQKIGYLYAIQEECDIVALLHGDGQYAPEMLPELILPLVDGEADVVFGSRMVNKRDALKGGMPYYKFVGNIILTGLQNRLLGSRLAEFHTGYRLYKVQALKSIPFTYNSNNFDFDTDIIIQLIHNQYRIKEIPIPTHYGDEVCHVNGVKYAVDILLSTVLAQVQRFGIYYNPKFDYTPDKPAYRKKVGYPSSHTAIINAIKPRETVVDICYGEGYITKELHDKGCKLYVYYESVTDGVSALCKAAFQLHLNAVSYDFTDIKEAVDVVVIGDTLGRSDNPYTLLTAIRNHLYTENQRIIITTGNIAFLLKRIGLLLGQFNYSRVGTTDFFCRRLFTFSSLKRTVEHAGFTVNTIQGIPVPFPLVFGNNKFSHFLLFVNMQLIKLSKGLFSYQIMIEATANPPLHVLLERAKRFSK